MADRFSLSEIVELGIQIEQQSAFSRFCLKCRGCCRFSEKDSIWSPRLLNEEKNKKKLKLTFNRIQGSFVCSLLDIENNKCKIYLRRPFECGLYPFVINRKNNKIFLALHLSCPFITQNLKTHKLKKYTQCLIKLFSSPKYKNILKNNPHIIQKYNDEVLNIFELKIYPPSLFDADKEPGT